MESAEIAAVGDDLSAERREALQTVSGKADRAELPISAGPGDGRHATVEVASSRRTGRNHTEQLLPRGEPWLHKSPQISTSGLLWAT